MLRCLRQLHFEDEFELADVIALFTSQPAARLKLSHKGEASGLSCFALTSWMLLCTLSGSLVSLPAPAVLLAHVCRLLQERMQTSCCLTAKRWSCAMFSPRGC